VDVIYTNHAILGASGLEVTLPLVGTIGVTGSSWIQMTFPSSRPAGRTSYVRIDLPTTTGLVLDLSNLANILGLLDNNVIKVTSNGGATASKIVKDVSGNYYIAVTPASNY